MSGTHQDISLGFSHRRFAGGAHMCMLYRDETERRGVISKYIESGLLNDEKIGYFVDTMKPEEVKSWLAELGVEVPEGKQITISPASSTYCPHNIFVPEVMLENLRRYHEQSIAEGFSGARLSGEMTWSLRNIPGSERLIEYEALINTILKTHPIAALCQYDATKFDGGLLFDILQVHPLMVVHGQIVENPAYIRPEEFLKEYHNRA
ncbi:MEDS domain-containing protein [Legionella bononiensis]|uniref:MEDS domain-containing protein n=1 Tax=Legionella bononiensis TaxID=2793102 RepID=A0ABS1WBL3_9GAMM|nr:MEDS domain-containing protein [Legionella bononiensis]MBL7481039.1 MEDS domain-containing protein [Legionella bononiensis]MBL7526747.1 MEDS domain-containing protein [Legionella bononiensis]MBL7564154.1 MEDS domain-containing protein [Legionella bononiensis]